MNGHIAELAKSKKPHRLNKRLRRQQKICRRCCQAIWSYEGKLLGAIVVLLKCIKLTNKAVLPRSSYFDLLRMDERFLSVEK